MSKHKKPAPTSHPDATAEDAVTEESALEPGDEETSDLSPPVTRIEEVATAAANAEPTEETLALGAELEAELGAADQRSDEPTQESAANEDLLEDLSGEVSDGSDSDGWEEPTRVAEADQLAELQAQSAVEPAAEGAGDAAEPLTVESQTRLESIIESLLFAAERPLNLADLKRLVNERDAKKLIAALGALQARHQVMGIQLASAAGGWQFRTNPENAVWVAKMVAGRPARLSRAMLETLAIVAYRQPITRPEIDEIRGVDCGPVLKTLLDRALVRMIGKKEEVGRPILYGTTPEFLRTFSLKDLSELPTLRQFHELGVAEQAKVDAETPAAAKGAAGQPAADAGAPRAMPTATNLPEHDPDEEEALLAELDDATASATRATRSPDPVPPVPPEASEAGD